MNESFRRTLALIRWETVQLSRFPYGEIILALLVFQAVLRSPPWAVFGPLTQGWEYAHDFLMTFGALNTVSSLEDMYLPISLFTAILVGGSVTGELQSSFGRALLSTPLRKGEYFIAKLASLSLLLWVLSLIAIVVSVAVRGFDFTTLIGPRNATFWPGVVIACGIVSLFVASLSTAIAFGSRSQPTTVLLSTALLVGWYFLGRATKSTLLPPEALGTNGLLYLANPSGASSLSYLLTLAVYLGVTFVVGFSGFLWFTRRWDSS